MPRYVIPANAGPYRVVTARGGNALVLNAYSGSRKVRIPCRTRAQAEALCKHLNERREEGEVFV